LKILLHPKEYAPPWKRKRKKEVEDLSSEKETQLSLFCSVYASADGIWGWEDVDMGVF
jgi:hypothetical protein